jgi:hypothetical protein
MEIFADSEGVKMGRKKIYYSNAQRQKAYRHRLGNGKAIAKRYEIDWCCEKKLAVMGSIVTIYYEVKK